jgi:hypothetical protein
LTRGMLRKANAGGCSTCYELVVDLCMYCLHSVMFTQFYVATYLHFIVKKVFMW